MRLIITSGEPAGIGPDIVIQLAQQAMPFEWVVLADKLLLQQRADLLGVSLEILEYQPGQAQARHRPGSLWVQHIPLGAPCVAGELKVANAGYVLEMLRIAAQACLKKEFTAVVTAPVQKSVMQDSGVYFSGHTEFFAELTQTPDVVMLLTTQGMRVALVTTHLPLAEVPAAITTKRLLTTLTIVDKEMREKFGIVAPRIAVSGLNPHAGENGYLGEEEITVIQPTLKRLRESGMNVSGPLPADTLFLPQQLSQYDVAVTMYHDQGLPVIKHVGFGHCVNVTLGLPIIRTSVDHGTALSLAGSGKAQAESLMAACEMAVSIAVKKHKYESQ